MKEDFDERVAPLDLKVENLEKSEVVNQQHLKSLRDSVKGNEKLLHELENVCATLNTLIEEIRKDREKEKETRSKYIFWFITTIGGILITSIMALIIL